MSVAALKRQLAASSIDDVKLRPYFTVLCQSIAASMIQDHYLLADITALVAIDFATNALKLGIPDEAVNVKRWYGVVSKRADVNA
jgi:hypothetical protein